MINRSIHSVYEDPLDLVWTGFCRQIGIELVRSPEVFASWDGVSQLKIGTADTLDKDDSLAQMVFHETCHALIEGERGVRKPDWGLDIQSNRHRHHEFATLRLQAGLSDRFGLRNFLAATTQFRIYYDMIPDDVLQPVPSLDESGLLKTSDLEREPAVIQLVRDGLQRAENGPWSTPLRNALSATQLILDAAAPFATQNSIWRKKQARLNNSVSETKPESP